MAPAQVISLQDLPHKVLKSPVHHAPGPTVPAPAVASAPSPSVMAERPEPFHAAPVPAPAAVSGAVPVFAPESGGDFSVNEGTAPVPGTANAAGNGGWEHALEAEAQKLLAGGQNEVWDALTRRFESRLIRTALAATHGRRMEAAQRLGIGRNTITRKIQELGLDAPDES
jgi:two-component system nitrogen regulation response regulator GlnG